MCWPERETERAKPEGDYQKIQERRETVLCEGADVKLDIQRQGKVGRARIRINVKGK